MAEVVGSNLRYMHTNSKTTDLPEAVPKLSAWSAAVPLERLQTGMIAGKSLQRLCFSV